MRRVVIDASVAIKWVVEEEGAAEALAVLERHPLSAADLIVAECASILWKKVRRGELTPDEAELAADLLQRAEPGHVSQTPPLPPRRSRPTVTAEIQRRLSLPIDRWEPMGELAEVTGEARARLAELRRRQASKPR